MATEMKMPQLSDTMDKGKILGWRKAEGEPVSRGDILAEVETDKANLEIECFTPGTLLKILVPAGSTAAVGQAIAIVGQPGESVSSGTGSPSSAAPGTSTRENSSATPVAAANGAANGVHNAHAASANQARPQTSVTEDRPGAGANSFRDAADHGRVRASPLAKRLAEHHSINLSGILGSGPDGRIVKRDVEQRVQSANLSASVSGVGSPSAFAPGSNSPQTGQLAQHSASRVQVEGPARAPESSAAQPSRIAPRSYPLSKMRETIARRMQESVTQAPHFYVTTAIDMDQALAFREALKERAEYKGISVNHLVIKACAYALAQEPRVNRSLRDGLVFEPGDINIGIITAINDGLLIPVVRNADQLPLRDVVFEARAGIERARAGRPTSSDLSGGTFSISNMGMFDVENFTAIISPGQGGVLAVSAVQEQAVVRKGQITVVKQMKVTLSVDHRVIDGIMAAQWLKHFKDALEIPALMMT